MLFFPPLREMRGIHLWHGEAVTPRRLLHAGTKTPGSRTTGRPPISGGILFTASAVKPLRMRRALCLGLVVLAAISTNCSRAGAPAPAAPMLPDAPTLDAVTRDALSEDPRTARSGIERLRELGPPGLAELLSRANARGVLAALAGER